LTDIEAHLQAKTSEQHPVVHEVSTPEIQPGMRRFLPVALAAILLLIIAAIYGLVHNSKPAQNGPAQKPDVNASAASNSSPAKSSAGESPSGAVLQQVSPNASKNALRTIQGHLKVRVKVGVDASGNVTAENLITPGPSKYFSRLAMQAAQQWKFTPPKDNGQAIPSQWTILFEYTKGGISQQATLASH
jgi:TonB family protein